MSRNALSAGSNKDVEAPGLEEAVLICLDERKHLRNAALLERIHDSLGDKVISIGSFEDDKRRRDNVSNQMLVSTQCAGDADVDKESVPINHANIVIDKDVCWIARLKPFSYELLVLARNVERSKG